MEQALLIILEWLGKIIAAKLAGTAAASVWQRLQPTFRKIVASATVWKDTADRHTIATAEYEAALKRLEEATKSVPALLEDAAQKIAALERENISLKQRLAKHERLDDDPN